MTRTTLDIDASVLRELKLRRQREGKTLGQLVSELLVQALGQQSPPKADRALSWPSQDMRPLIDFEDKDALRQALEGR